MEDITDRPLRAVLLKTGRPDVFFTEFINVDGLLSKGFGKLSHRLAFYPEESPIIVQLWGKDPEKFYRASLLVKDLGFAGINVNMGCSVKKVLTSHCGAYIIKDFALANEIISSVKNAAGDLPVSVKTRVGFSDVEIPWIENLLSQKLDTVFLHARTASQLFSGRSDWEIFRSIIEKKGDTKIVGNGDVNSLEEARKLQDDYGLDGIMIGRAVLRNPWVFSSNVPSREERLSTLLFHLNEMKKLCDEYPNRNWMSIKKFYHAYLREENDLCDLRMNLMMKDSVTDSIDLISDFIRHES